MAGTDDDDIEMLHPAVHPSSGGGPRPADGCSG